MKELLDFMGKEKKVVTGKTVLAGAVGGVMALAGILTLCYMNRKKRMNTIEMDDNSNEQM